MATVKIQKLIQTKYRDKHLWKLTNEIWTTREVGLLHSVFYIGYFITHIPAGYLTTVWPCHRMFGGCILFSAVLNLLLPLAIEEIRNVAPFVVRFLQGLSEGLLYPACYGVLRHWSTPAERGRLVSVVLTGCFAGAILGFPLAGILTHYIGWQFVFYVSGGMCIAWYFSWLWIVTEKPSHCRSISDEELEYLDTAQGNHTVDYENLKAPWMKILTSLPVIALCLCHFTRNWVFVLMLTNEPFFLNVFGFTIKENGLFSALPHVMKVTMALAGGYFSDWLLLHQFLSVTKVRKLFTGIGFGGQALCLFLLTFSRKGAEAVILLCIGSAMFGLSVSGWQINHYDLAARYPGLLVGITSAFGSLAAIAVPLVVGELTVKQDLESWDNVFYVTIAVLVLPTVFYLIFGSGTQQSWAYPPVDFELVQKVDPLARRPYKLKTQQKTMSFHQTVSDKVCTRSVQDQSDLENRLLHRLTNKMNNDSTELDSEKG